MYHASVSPSYSTPGSDKDAGLSGSPSPEGEQAGKVGGWIPDTKLQALEYFDYENTYFSFISSHLNTQRFIMGPELLVYVYINIGRKTHLNNMCKC